MLLLLGELAQPSRHRERLLELAELDERFDELRSDREDARLVDALALACAPRRRAGSRLPRSGSCASSAAIPRARSASSRSQPTPLASERAIASSAQRAASSREGRCPRQAAPGSARTSARQQLPLGRLGPLVEQALPRPPSRRTQLELAQVQAQQGVRDDSPRSSASAALCRQQRSSSAELAAPDVALARDPFRGGGENGGCARGGAEAAAEIVDRTPAQSCVPRRACTARCVHLRPSRSGLSGAPPPPASTSRIRRTRMTASLPRARRGPRPQRRVVALGQRRVPGSARRRRRRVRTPPTRST